jgi:hypothetical protein
MQEEYPREAAFCLAHRRRPCGASAIVPTGVAGSLLGAQVTVQLTVAATRQ